MFSKKVASHQNNRVNSTVVLYKKVINLESYGNERNIYSTSKTDIIQIMTTSSSKRASSVINCIYRKTVKYLQAKIFKQIIWTNKNNLNLRQVPFDGLKTPRTLSSTIIHSIVDNLRKVFFQIQ